MNEFRHDKDFIVVIKQIIAGKKSKEDLLSLQEAWNNIHQAWKISPAYINPLPPRLKPRGPVVFRQIKSFDWTNAFSKGPFL
jgi:hypothetical protein